MARHHTRQVQSSEAVTKKLPKPPVQLALLPHPASLPSVPTLLLPAQAPPPKQQSQRRPPWPHSVRSGCSSTVEPRCVPAAACAAPAACDVVPARQATPPLIGPTEACVACGIDHSRSERSSLPEASSRPQGDQRTLQARKQRCVWVRVLCLRPCLEPPSRGAGCSSTASLQHPTACQHTTPVARKHAHVQRQQAGALQPASEGKSPTTPVDGAHVASQPEQGRHNSPPR